MHATAVTASQSMPAGQLSVRIQWPAVTTVARTPFRVHSCFGTCFFRLCCLSLSMKVNHVNLSFYICSYFRLYFGEVYLSIMFSAYYYRVAVCVTENAVIIYSCFFFPDQLYPSSLNGFFRIFVRRSFIGNRTNATGIIKCSSLKIWE